jgi:hypothetical protein
MRHLLLFALTTCALSCAAEQHAVRWGEVPAHAALTRAQLNTPAAIRRDYMRSGDTAEALPSAAEPTLVIDEAMLTRVEPGQTCMLVTLRTESTYDASITEARPRCLMDDREVAGVVVGEEQAAPLEQWWEERGLAGYIFNEKTDHMVQITSRVATVCCPDAPHRRLELRMTHPLLGLPPREIYRLKLAWELSPDHE